MRQLHVVALSEDGRSVLLATSKAAKTGTFTLPLDAKLAAALRGDVPRAGEQQARAFDLTPKEIQSRLRAGESPEQIASAAGVPVARVERFAGPVLSERERIIEEARAGFISRNRRGPSQLPLGDAVDAALAGTSGLRSESVTWTARRLESGHWLVQVSYVARARTRTASWVYEPHTRAVTASDPASAALGHVGDETGPRRSSTATAVAKPARKKPAAAKKPAVKKAVKKAAPKPAAAKAAKKAVKKAVKKAPKPVATKKAPAKPVTKKPVVTKKAVARKRSPKPADLAGPPTLRVVPSPVIEPAPQETAAKRRAAGERAHVPDWADVLLGIAPKRSDD